MFFLVEPSTGVALPILAGRTQLYGRFTGTPDDGMIVDIAVRSVRKCRNEVFDEDSSDSGDVSFRRFLEKNGERTIRTWRSTSNKTTVYYANSSNAGGATTTTESYAKPFIFFGAGWVKETRRMSSGTMAMAVARAIAMVATTFGKSSNKMGPVSSRIPVCIAIAVRNTISNHTVRIPNAARYTNNATALAILPRKSAST